MRYDLIDNQTQPQNETATRLRGMRTTVVLWLMALLLALVIIPLLMIFRWVREDVDRLAFELERVELGIESANLPSPEMNRLELEMAAVEELIAALESANVPSGIDWPQMASAIESHDPVRVSLQSITQTGNRIRLTGRAADYDDVAVYADALADFSQIGRVNTLSMTFAPTTPPAADESDSTAADLGPQQPIEFVLELVVEPQAGANRISPAQEPAL